MNEQAMQHATREAVKKKFKRYGQSPSRKRFVSSRAASHPPAGAEREYIRTVNAYMALFKKSFAVYWPEIRTLLETASSVHTDEADPKTYPEPTIKPIGAEILAANTTIYRVFSDMMSDFEQRQGLFDLRDRLEKLSKLNKKLSIAEWKRVVKRTLGIDIMDDYYNGVKFQQIFDKWVADNVGLIKTIPQGTLGKMNDIVRQGYLNGETGKDIARQIQEAYCVDKNHAVFIARDQTAKLNAHVTREQQADAGVTEYIWSTSGDARVRDSHAELNNKRFRYIDPPIVDDKTGRRANPGEDYQCRCVALPVFDLETVVLPWERGGSG